MTLSHMHKQKNFEFVLPVADLVVAMTFSPNRLEFSFSYLVNTGSNNLHKACRARCRRVLTVPVVT